MATGHTLSEQQLAALDLLLGGEALTGTAQALGLHRSTVSGWKNRHLAFQAALQRGRQELSESVRQRLVAFGTRAVETLSALLDDPSSRVRLLASKTILQQLWAAGDREAQLPPPGGLEPPWSYSGAGEVLPVPAELTAAERETVRTLFEMVVGGGARLAHAEDNLSTSR
ncbi:MAG: hypothetical protein D6731_16290 [Planctomycetota bacterium]|nr:MAG: hypothetical protein D6731_16290 [Planctomycetota bacterium]